MNSFQSWLTENQGTQWSGRAELWTDPEGNDTILCDCSLMILPETLSYTWACGDEPQTGTFVFSEEGATWSDTWHQPEPVLCRYFVGFRGRFTIGYSYPAPPGPDWGWRITLSQRPDQSLVLQMTNIAPWGEEGRAVRMIFEKKTAHS